MKRILSSHMNKLAAIAIVALLGLAGCGGGAPTSENPVTSGPTAAATYLGPTPGNADVQAFKINLWDNIRTSDRCGKCHYAGGQTPSFARADDVNLAYQDANTVVNLTSPGESRMVVKVRGGHNCWLADPGACGDTLTKWITNWAGSSAGGTKTIQLVAPADRDVVASRSYPPVGSFQSNLWTPILRQPSAPGQYCSRCHSETAATAQQPYFASADVATAYDAAKSKINLDTPSMSRFVVRLRDENHNCWSNCADNANTILAAINAMAADAGTPAPIDPALVLSKALGIYDGVVASGGNRYDTNDIALYEFKTGSGTTAYDTSGVDPALDLTLTGDVKWAGGWGIQVNSGKAQGLTTTSKKLHDLIGSTGEYSIEAWAAPANVTQKDAVIVGYSGGTMVRNFTLGQSLYNYNDFGRSSGTDANGGPALSTPDAAKVLQASLQHTVATFDPVNGRRIYVNGALIASGDSAGKGTLADWDDTFAFVLGNEVSGNRQWQGTLKMVAIHNRALTLEQIQQNFAAGVGEKFFLLFNVSELVSVPQAYIMFEVSVYDSYSYLFNHPKFISLDATAKPGDIAVKGMRIGVNGKEALVGQAYSTLDMHITDAIYTSVAGANLSNVGTVIAQDQGPMADQFFLTFDLLGAQSHVRTLSTYPVEAVTGSTTVTADVGVRTFEKISATMSSITGISRNNASVVSTYTAVKQQMPTIEDISAFLPAHQVGIAQLAAAYCSELVNNPGNFFNGFNFTNATFATQTERDAVINPLVDKAMGTGVITSTAALIKEELGQQASISDPYTAGLHPSLIDNLCPGSSCPAGRAPVVVKAICTAVLSSGATIIQ